MFRQTRAVERHARLAVSAVAVIIALALVGGCATSRLETSGAETKITAKLRGLYPALQVGDTTCPAHVTLRDGGTFSCTVPVSGQTVHVEVRQEDSHGNVSFRTREYLLQPSVAAHFVRDATVRELIARNQSGPGDQPVVSVSCGTAALLLVAQPGTFDCRVTTPSGNYTEVGSVAADGMVNYSVPNPPVSSAS